VLIANADAGNSSIETYYYSTDGGSTWSKTLSNTYTYTLSNGTYTFAVKVENV